MTTTEAAARLHVTRAWIWRLIKRGVLAAEMRGRDWWIEPEEIERYRREKNPAHRPKKSSELTPRKTPDEQVTPGVTDRGSHQEAE